MIETARAGATSNLPEGHHLGDYLRFGGTGDIDLSDVDYVGLMSYLRDRGFGDGGLVQAHRDGDIRERIGEFRPTGVHYCDFCGKVMSGVEFERLKDGRERCPECSRSVLRGIEEYEELFTRVKRTMIERFGIDFPLPITVHVVSQRRLAKETQSTFTPTSGWDERCVGLARAHNGKMSMYFENGTPRLSLTATSAHELTHIWQYTHWDTQALRKRYGDAYEEVSEGMAVWVEIQYLYLVNEPAYADRYVEGYLARTDEYGRGFRRYFDIYPLSKGILLNGKTPFMYPKNPLG